MGKRKGSKQQADGSRPRKFFPPPPPPSFSEETTQLCEFFQNPQSSESQVPELDLGTKDEGTQGQEKNEGGSDNVDKNKPSTSKASNASVAGDKDESESEDDKDDFPFEWTSAMEALFLKAFMTHPIPLRPIGREKHFAMILATIRMNSLMELPPGKVITTKMMWKKLEKFWDLKSLETIARKQEADQAASEAREFRLPNTPDFQELMRRKMRETPSFVRDAMSSGGDPGDEYLVGTSDSVLKTQLLKGPLFISDDSTLDLSLVDKN